MRFLLLSIFCTTILFGCSFESKRPTKSSKQAKPTATAQPELKVHDGVASYANYVVGVVLGNTDSSCSGIVLKDRCVLTPRHCVHSGLIVKPRFVTDDNTVLHGTGLLGNNRTGVAKMLLKDDGGSGASEEYGKVSDLAMLWLAPHVCDGPDVPEDCDNTKSWTVGGWEEIPSNEINDLEDESVWVRGYGLTTVAPSPSGTPVDQTRSAGKMVIDDPDYWDVPDLGVGANLIDDSTYTGNHFTCAGDSGAAIASGNIAGNYPFGMVRSGTTTDCSGGSQSTKAIIFTEENAAWIEEKMDTFCVDTLKLDTLIIPYTGRIVGTVGESNTKVTDCGSGAESGYSCNAEVTEDVTLTVSPAEGWVFGGWDQTKNCPCENENPCVVPADSGEWVYEDNNGTDPAVNVARPEAKCWAIMHAGY